MAKRVAVLFGAAFVAHACHGVGAAQCPSTDVEPLADGLVLTASSGSSDPLEPDTMAPALVVAPNCEVTPLDLDLDEGFIDPDIPFVTSPPGDWTVVPGVEPDAVFDLALWVRDHVIARVQSLPKVLHVLHFVQCPTLTHGADFSTSRFLELVNITNCPSIKTLDNIQFSDSMRRLYVTGSKLNSVKNVQWPMQLKQLYLSSNQLTSAASIEYPEFLRALDLSGNPIPTLENVNFPTELHSLALPGVTTVRNVTWPNTLKELTIEASTITNFELRKSDFTALRSVIGKIKAKSTQSTCADSTATLETVNGKNFCVISDARFDAVYRTPGGIRPEPDSPTAPGSQPSSAPKPTSPSPPSKRPTTNRGSGTGSAQADGGQLEDATLSEPRDDGLPSPKKPSTTTEKKGDASDARTSSERSRDGGNSPGTRRNPPTANANNRSPSSSTKTPGAGSSGSSGTSTDQPPTNESTTKSLGSSHTVLAAVGASVGALLLLMLCIIARRRSSKPSKDDGSTSPSFTQLPATPRDSTGDGSGPRVGFLANDVRNDEQLAAFCLNPRELVMDKTIARGGFGVIYRGTYGDRAVAIKQMLPDAWRNDATLARFMDEIRLCASLEHPNIVEFVGIAWTSLRDLSVVTELMHRGDLHETLRKHTAPQPEDWQQMWTPAKLQNKTAIARDVAEAVVYLHSRPTPILHRDLKARNVLLGDSGIAKLSDFGISREVAIDVTMTSEIGTAAWIAPEVLRGERYSEKADIYSFGVLLVEMDTGRHPFAGVDASSSENLTPTGSVNSNNAFKQANMMLLVSTGKLRPTPSSACPLAIQSLVHECLRFDARERPTANEVVERLRQLLSPNPERREQQ